MSSKSHRTYLPSTHSSLVTSASPVVTATEDKRDIPERLPKYKSDKSDDINTCNSVHYTVNTLPPIVGTSYGVYSSHSSHLGEFSMRYKVLEPIGKGAHSVVFKVLDLDVAAKMMLHKKQNFSDKSIHHRSNSLKYLKPIPSTIKSEPFGSLYKAAKFIPLTSSSPLEISASVPSNGSGVKGVYTTDDKSIIRLSAGREEDRILRLLTSYNHSNSDNSGVIGEIANGSQLGYTPPLCPYIIAHYGTYVTCTHRIIVQELIEGGELYTEVANYHEREAILRERDEDRKIIMLSEEEIITESDLKKNKISKQPTSSNSSTSIEPIEAAHHTDIAAETEYPIHTNVSMLSSTSTRLSSTNDTMWPSSPSALLTASSVTVVGSVGSCSVEEEILRTKKQITLTMKDQRRHQWERIVAYYTHDLLKALEYIHARGVVHRDIKLENLMLVRKGSEKKQSRGIHSEEYKKSTSMPLLKLIDFGLSKQLEDSYDGLKTTSMPSIRPLISSSLKVLNNAPLSALGLISPPMSLVPPGTDSTVRSVVRQAPVIIGTYTQTATYNEVDELSDNSNMSPFVPYSSVSRRGGSYSIRSLKTCCGSPNYMAPEILRASRANQAILSSRYTGYGKEVDMWAAGVALFVMLYGDYPFRDGTFVSHKKILKGQYTIPFSYPYTYNCGIRCTAVRCGASLPFPSNHSIEGCEDLLKKLLCVEPNERITAIEALHHPWILRHTSDKYNII